MAVARESTPRREVAVRGGVSGAVRRDFVCRLLPDDFKRDRSIGDLVVSFEDCAEATRADHPADSIATRNSLRMLARGLVGHLHLTIAVCPGSVHR